MRLFIDWRNIFVQLPERKYMWISFLKYVLFFTMSPLFSAWGRSPCWGGWSELWLPRESWRTRCWPRLAPVAFPRPKFEARIWIVPTYWGGNGDWLINNLSCPVVTESKRNNPIQISSTNSKLVQIQNDLPDFEFAGSNFRLAHSLLDCLELSFVTLQLGLNRCNIKR